MFNQGATVVTPTSDAVGHIVPIAEVQEGGAEIIDRLAAEWRELCEHGPSEYPFYRPEWIRAYLRAFAPRSRVVVIAARAASRLVAVLPLVDEIGRSGGLPVRKLRAPANWHSCRFDLVRAEGAAGDAAVLSVWASLRALRRWQLLELSDVPEGSAVEQLVGAARADGFPVGRWASIRSPYIAITPHGDGKEWWPHGVSGGFRRDLQRVARNLSAHGDVRLTRVSEGGGDVLERFYDLERSGWKGREGTAIACDKVVRQFYDEIAGEARRFNYLSLYFLECGGRAVAGHFGLTYRGRYFAQKGAHDESYQQYAPGQLLMRATVRDCRDRGILEYDCLGPDDEFKMKWTTTVRPHSCFYVFRKGLYPRALWAARFRVLPAIKDILSRSYDAANGDAGNGRFASGR